MPRGDRTGPWGLGPMTGRAMGYCAGFPGPGFTSPGPGFGYGRGFGFGRGFGRGRGWRRAGFGPFWGYPYPPMIPYGMPYGYPSPQSYEFPYEMGYPPEYPAARSTPSGGKKK